MKKPSKKVILFLVFICFISLKAKAQDGPPPDPGVPFDGLSLALVAGVGYGMKKLMKNKKEQGYNTAEQENSK